MCLVKLYFSFNTFPFFADAWIEAEKWREAEIDLAKNKTKALSSLGANISASINGARQEIDYAQRKHKRKYVQGWRRKSNTCVLLEIAFVLANLWVRAQRKHKRKKTFSARKCRRKSAYEHVLMLMLASCMPSPTLSLRLSLLVWTRFNH